MGGFLSHSSRLCRIMFGVLAFPIAASSVAHAADGMFILAQVDKSEEPKKAAPAAYVVKPVTEKKVKQLPEGPLFNVVRSRQVATPISRLSTPPPLRRRRSIPMAPERGAR
jgi:hypothetical protein